jgi:hypothetical protein
VCPRAKYDSCLPPFASTHHSTSYKESWVHPSFQQMWYLKSTLKK